AHCDLNRAAPSGWACNESEMDREKSRNTNVILVANTLPFIVLWEFVGLNFDAVTLKGRANLKQTFVILKVFFEQNQFKCILNKIVDNHPPIRFDFKKGKSLTLRVVSHHNDQIFNLTLCITGVFHECVCPG
ncbi:MAG: hypothetical protein ACO3O0_08385, partial [Bacteroidia bacterium]